MRDVPRDDSREGAMEGAHVRDDVRELWEDVHTDEGASDYVQPLVWEPSCVEATHPGVDPESAGSGVCFSDEEMDAGILVPRVSSGVVKRVDRLRALGNAQVPSAMAAAFTYLAGEAGLLMEVKP